jgi:hypothetical protein
MNMFHKRRKKRRWCKDSGRWFIICEGMVWIIIILSNDRLETCKTIKWTWWEKGYYCLEYLVHKQHLCC